ncbi:hypothetical protein D3C78_741710 [compost metagenome]
MQGYKSGKNPKKSEKNLKLSTTLDITRPCRERQNHIGSAQGEAKPLPAWVRKSKISRVRRVSIRAERGSNDGCATPPQPRLGCAPPGQTDHRKPSRRQASRPADGTSRCQWVCRTRGTQLLQIHDEGKSADDWTLGANLGYFIGGEDSSEKISGDNAWMRVNGTSGGSLANDSFNASVVDGEEWVASPSWPTWCRPVRTTRAAGQALPCLPG